jgi:DNA-binding NarL/FixJ family response regulator
MKDQLRPVNKVLIVDDHPIVCEGLRRLIDQEDDFTVCGIEEDIEGALQATLNQTPDIVIVDLNLKGEDGLRLIIQYPDIPMLVLSMHGARLFIKRALHAGARGYLTKQEASEEVLSALRSILGGKIYLSRSLSLVEDPVETLSKREFEVFRMVGTTDLGTRQIAEELNLSVKTVESHKRNIKGKLGLTSATGLIRYAMRWSEHNDPASNHPSLESNATGKN